MYLSCMKKKTSIHAGISKAGFVLDEQKPVVIVTKTVGQAKILAKKNPQTHTLISFEEAKIWGAGVSTSGKMVTIQ